MSHTDKVYKDDGALDEAPNKVTHFRNRLVRVQPRGEDARGVTGVVIDVTDDFLVLQHRDGRTTFVRISDIISIAELSLSSPRRSSL